MSHESVDASTVRVVEQAAGAYRAHIATGLTLAGVALVGVVTATLAAWFVQRLGQVEAETRDDAAEVAAELRRLRSDLLAAREGSGGEV